jgi:hypothetical protein
MSADDFEKTQLVQPINWFISTKLWHMPQFFLFAGRVAGERLDYGN